jgi:hypothetical protein
MRKQDEGSKVTVKKDVLDPLAYAKLMRDTANTVDAEIVDKEVDVEAVGDLDD